MWNSTEIYIYTAITLHAAGITDNTAIKEESGVRRALLKIITNTVLVPNPGVNSICVF